MQNIDLKTPMDFDRGNYNRILSLRHLFLIILLFPLFFIILSSNINALSLNDSSLVFYVSFDDNLNDIKHGAIATDDGTNDLAGIIGKGRGFVAGDTDKITYPDSSYLDIGNQSFTICSWVFIHNSIAGTAAWITKSAVWNTDVDYAIVSYHGATAEHWEKQEFTRGDGIADNFKTTNAITKNAWHYVCLVYNYVLTASSNASFYVDGSFSNSDLTFRTGKNNSALLNFGYDGTGAWTYGSLDEVGIWKRALSSTDITYLYNSGYGCNPVTNDTQCNTNIIITPTLTLSSNLIANTQSNSNPYIFYFNGTTEYTPQTNFNCSLRLNNTINQTKNLLNLAVNQNFTLLTNNWERTYTFNVSCRNNNATGSFERPNITIDTIPPNLLFSADIVNNSVYDDVDAIIETLDFDVTVTDTNLYAYNRTITNVVTGANISQFFIENINKSSYTDVVTQNIDFGGDTELKILVEAWDSHTTNALKYKAKQILGTIWYNGVAFYCDDHKSIKFNQKIDKITVDVKFNKNSGTCYAVGNWQKIDNSQYPNHYIDFKRKVWIDEYDAIVTLDKGKLILNYDKSEITTQSIGDLNYNSAVYYVNVSYTSTALMTAEALENINTQISLIKDEAKTFNNTLIFIISVVLFIILKLGYFVKYTNDGIQEDFSIKVVVTILFLICMFLYSGILRYASIVFLLFMFTELLTTK